MGLNIALIDKSEIIKKMLSHSLHYFGAEIHRFENLASFPKNESFDLVFIDWDLKMGTQPLALMAQEQIKQTPIVVLHRDSQDTQLEKFHHQLKKPINANLTRELTAQLVPKVNQLKIHKFLQYPSSTLEESPPPMEEKKEADMAAQLPEMPKREEALDSQTPAEETNLESPAPGSTSQEEGDLHSSNIQAEGADTPSSQTQAKETFDLSHLINENGEINSPSQEEVVFDLPEMPAGNGEISLQPQPEETGFDLSEPAEEEELIQPTDTVTQASPEAKEQPEQEKPLDLSESTPEEGGVSVEMPPTENRGKLKEISPESEKLSTKDDPSSLEDDIPPQDTSPSTVSSPSVDTLQEENQKLFERETNMRNETFTQTPAKGRFFEKDNIDLDENTQNDLGPAALVNNATEQNLNETADEINLNKYKNSEDFKMLVQNIVQDIVKESGHQILREAILKNHQEFIEQMLREYSRTLEFEKTLSEALKEYGTGTIKNLFIKNKKDIVEKSITAYTESAHFADFMESTLKTFIQESLLIRNQIKDSFTRLVEKEAPVMAKNFIEAEIKKLLDGADKDDP